jgi:hypothetical protein
MNNVSEKLLEILWLKCTNFRFEIIFGNTGMNGGNQNKRWWDALPKGTTQLNWTTEGRFLQLPLDDQASGRGSGDGSSGYLQHSIWHQICKSGSMSERSRVSKPLKRKRIHRDFTEVESVLIADMKQMPKQHVK